MTRLAPHAISLQNHMKKESYEGRNSYRAVKSRTALLPTARDGEFETNLFFSADFIMSDITIVLKAKLNAIKEQ